ncbi:hypothetical protein K2X92_05800 [Candidatus Gracilibacteria bacterium]|nr:hypothetical protein [Candidatus Gracilibacteria bacterium]
MNKFITTSLAVAVLSGCMQKNPIEIQKDNIITSMNQILSEEKLKIETGSDCLIIIEGNKSEKTMFAELTCADGTSIKKRYEIKGVETYISILKKIQTKDGKLITEGACMQIISTDPKNSEGPKRVVESADCPKFTV